MLKLFITAIDSRENGTAVPLFENHEIVYSDKDELVSDQPMSLSELVFTKIESVEKINNQTTTPF